MSKDFSQHTDIELWQAFKDGSEEAFAWIYQQHAPQLYNYGRHFAKDRQLVEDCVHDLFVHLHQRRKTLGDTDSIKYYLFRALRRRITENSRFENHYTDEVDSSVFHHSQVTSSPELQWIEAQSSAQQNQQLLAALGQLPGRQREALYLLYYNNLSYKEAASVMSLEVRTVYNQVHAALASLNRYLRKAPLFLLFTLLLVVTCYW